MSSLNTKRKTESPASRPTYKFRILVMCDGELHPAIWRELELLPGSIVQACHNFFELLLHLEHETFQLVMIFEDEKPSFDCQAAANYLAEAYRGTPVLVTKRSAINRHPEMISEHLN